MAIGFAAALFGLVGLLFLSMGLSQIVVAPEKVTHRADIEHLASDALDGRNENATGSLFAQEHLIDQMQAFGAVGLNGGGSRDAFRQELNVPRATNILGALEGSKLPDEHVFLSAHCDHLSSCWRVENAASRVCNGAADNVAGVAIVLGTGRAIAALSPRRSIVFAFWDAEEDGLAGSECCANTNPLVPVDLIVTFLNWDVQGTNLLPSLRDISFAIGPETGGEALQRAVDRAVENEGLDVGSISEALGQCRSDHANFCAAPLVFFSDANNGCYHTSGDEIKVLGFGKLEKQARIGLKLAHELASTERPPSHRSSLIPVSFNDAKTIQEIATQAVENDLALFDSYDQEILKGALSELNCIVDSTSFFFLFDVLRFLSATGSIVDVLSQTECSGYLLEEA